MNEILNDIAKLLNQHITTTDKLSDRDRANVGTARVDGDVIVLTGTKFRCNPDVPVTARLVERNGKTWMQFAGYVSSSICGTIFQGVRAAHPDLKFKAGAF